MAAKVTFATERILDASLQGLPAWKRWLWVYVEALLAEGNGNIQTSLGELSTALQWDVGFKTVGPAKPAVSKALDELREPAGWDIAGSLLGISITKSKPGKSKRVSRTDPYAEAFRVAFDAHFGTRYTWNKGDFVQLTAWRKAYPNVTAPEFGGAATGQWDRGQHCPRYALTIRGLCASWATMKATMMSREADTQTPAEKALAEARRQEAMEA